MKEINYYNAKEEKVTNIDKATYIEIIYYDQNKLLKKIEYYKKREKK